MVEDIKDKEVYFASMEKGYRVYHSNQRNDFPNGVIHVAYQIVKDNVKWDICEMIRSQVLVMSMERIKRNEKQPIKYAILLVCIFFYIQIFFYGRGKVTLSKDKSVLS